MIPKLIHRRTAASVFVVALILVSSSFSIATISSVGRQSTGSHALPSQATSVTRSEEHTSELQSRVDLVCRLLLEKKNRSYGSAEPKNAAKEPAIAVTTKIDQTSRKM